MSQELHEPISQRDLPPHGDLSPRKTSAVRHPARRQPHPVHAACGRVHVNRIAPRFRVLVHPKGNHQTHGPLAPRHRRHEKIAPLNGLTTRTHPGHDDIDRIGLPRCRTQVERQVHGIAGPKLLRGQIVADQGTFAQTFLQETLWPKDLVDRERRISHGRRPVRRIQPQGIVPQRHVQDRHSVRLQPRLDQVLRILQCALETGQPQARMLPRERTQLALDGARRKARAVARQQVHGWAIPVGKLPLIVVQEQWIPITGHDQDGISRFSIGRQSQHSRLVLIAQVAPGVMAR